MKKIPTLIVAAAAALIGAPFWVLPSDAQGQPSPQALQAANTLVSLISPGLIGETSAQTLNQVWPRLESALRGRYPTISQEALNAIRTEVQNLQNGYTAEVLKDAPAIYARFYTADELQQLLAFYKTPIGVKSVQRTPAISAEILGLLNSRIGSMQERTDAAINAILRVYGYATP